MSGIAGLYYRDKQPAGSDLLQRMVAILAHRGPDGSGTWQEGPVGLGHRMLWTTPESLSEKLPSISSDGTLVMTADARIDNRDELRSALQPVQKPAHKIADSELILAAYEKWGPACPQRLLGAFAFVIWDRRENQLFCARDHFGVKPFYYFLSEQVFVFASEIKALLCLPQVPYELNEARIGDYLAQLYEDEAFTFYKNVLRLPPASTLTVNDSSSRLVRYWHLDQTHELKLDSDHAYAEAFRTHFFEAVRCRLRSAFPVGTTLSGGLDSSSVTCAAQKLLAKQGTSRLHTFSLTFNDINECDETDYINAVLEETDYISHFAAGDRISPLVDIDRVFWHLEQPSFGSGMYFVWRICSAFRELSVRNFLTGHDGDSVVSHGAAYLTELAYKGHWSRFFAEASALAPHFKTTTSDLLKNYGLVALPELIRHRRWLAFLQRAGQLSHQTNLSRARLLWLFGARPLLPTTITQKWNQVRGYKINNFDKFSYINPELTKRYDLDKRINALYAHPPLSAREEHWQRISTGITALNFEMFDHIAAAFGVTAQHPFFDKRLVEFCLALPPDQKLRHGQTRYILRAAMAPYLPHKVQQRGGKTDMGANFAHALLTFEKETLDKIILHNSPLLATYVDINVVQQTYQRVLAGQAAHRWDRSVIWHVVTLGLWLQHCTKSYQQLSRQPASVPGLRSI